MRPTEIADMLFSMGHKNNAEIDKTMPQNLQTTLNFLIQALWAMNTGLRATYMKLEDMERQVKAINGSAKAGS